MASAGVGLFLSSLRRAFSGGIFIELRSLFAILRGCAQHQSFRSLSDLPGRADSKVALHLFDRRGRPSSKGGQPRLKAVVSVWAKRSPGRGERFLKRDSLSPLTGQ